MTRRSSNQGSGGRRRFLPQLEALEDRCVPAVNFIVNGDTLLVQPASGRPHTSRQFIVINDNGSEGPNNVTAFSQGNFFPNVTIHTVIVITGSGNDEVDYNLTGDLVGPRVVFITEGNGNNTFNGTLRRNFLPGSSLTMTVLGGAGQDNQTVFLIGNLQTTSNVQLNLFGGGGSDTLECISTTQVNVDSGANLGVNLSGATGNDRIIFNYAGTLNGNLNISADGGSGNDLISQGANLTPDSTGGIPFGQVQGGPGNDTITFVVINPSAALANNLLLNGGLGFNTDFRSTNIIQIFCQNDNVVS